MRKKLLYRGFVGGKTMTQFWKLAILCSIGSICVVLGVILKIPVIIQTILIFLGLILSILGLIRIAKFVLSSEKNK